MQSVLRLTGYDIPMQPGQWKVACPQMSYRRTWGKPILALQLDTTRRNLSGAALRSKGFTALADLVAN